MNADRIVVVEDHAPTLNRICAALEESGYDALPALDGHQALDLLDEESVSLVLSDYRMNPIDGLALLKEIRKSFDIPFILYSSAADSEAVFRAGRDGAFFFLEYPFRVKEQLLPTIENGLSLARPRPEPERQRGAARFIGSSKEAQRVRSAIARVAGSNASVLVSGETGTGKELVARAIHEESGRRVFVPVAVTELSEGVLESELFGHERGAFTGASARNAGLFSAADGGTLFLDEIGDASPSVQAKLLRVLEAGEVRAVGATRASSVDVRVIAATHRDLVAAAGARRFRSDLFYRIRQATIHVLPLRERAADVAEIAEVLLADLAAEARLPLPQSSDEFREMLGAQPWPGNVRELRSVLQNVLLSWDRQALLGPSELIEARMMLDPGLSADDQLSCQRMIEAFRRSRGNQEAARRQLEMSRGEWRYRWRRFGLEPLARRRGN